MKLSNFMMIERKGKSPIDFRYFADVDVTTGFLWRKKTERKRISRSYTGSWFFIDNGEFVSIHEIDALERAWAAKNGGVS